MRFPREVSAVSRSCLLPDVPDVCVHQPSLPVRDRGPCRALLARAEQASADGNRGLGEDGRLRRHAANEPVRIFDSGAKIPDPETFGEYQLSYRTGRHRVAAHRGNGAARPGARPILPPRSWKGPAVSSAAVGLDVIRTIEAVDRSLAERRRPGGARRRARCGLDLTETLVGEVAHGAIDESRRPREPSGTARLARNRDPRGGPAGSDRCVHPRGAARRRPCSRRT